MAHLRRARDLLDREYARPLDDTVAVQDVLGEIGVRVIEGSAELP